MIREEKYLAKEFAVYCLTRYYKYNHIDLRLALTELKQSNKNPIEFLQQFLQRKNEDTDAIAQRIADWKKSYAKREARKSFFRKLKTPLLLIILVSAGYFIWQYIDQKKEEKKEINRDTLYVITTSGFRAHDTPAMVRSYRRFFQYGDTVTNLHDTVNGWLKFSHRNSVLYGPSKYFVTEDLFMKYDSLFKNYHYNKFLETVNSKAAFCVYDFIVNNLHSSVKDWHIPLQPLSKRQMNHAVLSMPKKIDFVNVAGEGMLEKYHLLLLSRRDIVSADSVNHYVLLLELLPNGSVIKKEDFPIAVADTACYIAIEDFDNFLRGTVRNNIFLRTAERKILRLTWQDAKEAPKWEWME